MILIAHRGNLEGPNSEYENRPEYIEEALSKKYDVEIDLWLIDGNYFLGHDGPEYPVKLEWLLRRSQSLWVHCKNVEAMSKLDPDYFNFFWHENDTVVLTSHCDLWAYPGKQPIKNSIAVMPEIHNDNLDFCKGICTDFVLKYKQELNKK
jgi:hypothetical protein